MKRILFLFLALSLGLLHAEITAITPDVKKRMVQGGSWHKGCPVALDDLRYIRVDYLDFGGNRRKGELVMHRDAAKDIEAIFGELYEIGYPVKSMRLVSDFGANDWRSIEAGNTSAFNCRRATGSKKWSKHAYGRAIDINPIENPYISGSGHIAHKASQRYRRRVHRHSGDSSDRALLLRNDKAVQIFKKYGWRWGGEWSGVKDYQHFFKP